MMKRKKLIVALAMCFMSVSLFASPVLGDDDAKVVKVFSQVEVIEMSSMYASFSEISSITLMEEDGKEYLEITGVDGVSGEAVTVVKYENFELLPCGTCSLKRNGQPVEAMILLMNGGEYCIQCPLDEVPYGPVAPGPQP